MNQIRLIAFDLDGTLLKDNKELTPRTLDALKNASRPGFIWFQPQGACMTVCRRRYARFPLSAM